METKSTDTDKLVTLRTVADRLHVSTRVIYRMIARDDFPRPVKIGGATRFFQGDIERYLDALRANR